MKVKRIFAIVMSVMLTFTMLPYFSAGDFRADAATSLQDKLVQEALDSNYVGKGYFDVRKAMRQKHGTRPYSPGVYTDQTGGDWCAWYIMACAKNAGLSDLIPAKESGVRVDHLCENIVNVGGGTITFVNKTYQNKTSISCNKQRVKYDSNYKPKKGDIVLFGYPNTPCTHVGIVTNDASSWKNAKTVEGNTSNDNWKKSIVSIRSTGLDRGDVVPLAFVTPKYGGSSGDESVAGSEVSFTQQEYINKYGNAAKIYIYLVNKGLSKNGAFGVLGNIQAESGFRPGIEEYATGIGYGICQWSFGRRSNLESYAKQKGKKVSDLYLQCDFLWKELNYSRYSGLLATLMSNTITPSTAADKFVRIFEVPANVDSTSLRRQQFAREWEAKLKDMPICNGHTCIKTESIKAGICDTCGEPYTKWDTIIDISKWNTSSSIVSNENCWYKIKNAGEKGIRLKLYPNENSNNATQINDDGKTEAVRVINGQGVQVRAKNNSGWYKVKTKTGKIGYINEKYIEAHTPATEGDSTLNAILSSKTATKLYRGENSIVKGSISSNYPLVEVAIKYKNGDVVKRYFKDFDNYIYSSVTLNDTWEFVRNANMKNLGSGTWEIWIYAKDASKKIFEKKLGSVVISDPEVAAPTIEKTAIEGGYKVKVSNNAGGDLYVSIDGKLNKRNSPYTANITTEGIHIIKAYVWSGGKRSPNKERTVEIGIASEPVINIAQANGKANVTFTKGEPSDTIMYKIGSIGKFKKYEGEVVEATDGDKIEAYAIGVGCYKSGVVSETVNLTAPDVPDVDVISSDTTIAQGDPVTIGWNKDNNASSYTVRLLKDGTLKKEITTDSTTATFTLDEEGTYTIEVTAVNDVGQGETSSYQITAAAPLSVTFMDADDGNGQSVIASLKVKYGDTPKNIATPSRKGYTFIGWNSSLTGDTSINAYLTRPVTEDITYTAEYSRKEYTVKFYDVNGDLLDTIQASYGEAITPPEVAVVSGETFMGWNVIKVSDENSKADVSFVDCDMTLQAVTKWENADLPVNIEWESADLINGNSTVAPKLTVTADKEKEQNIYLILSLKSSVDGVDKTLYADRQKFTIPLGENSIEIGGDGSNYSFELKPSANLDMSTVEKIEAFAVECRDDGTTGGAVSEIAVIDGLDYPSTRGEQNLPYRPEEKEGRIITEKMQYRTITTESVHSSSDTLEGYTNTGITEYYDLDNDSWSAEPVYTWSNWSSSKPTGKSEDEGTYIKVVEFNENNSSMHQNAYRSVAYFSDCKKAYAHNLNYTCSECGGKTKNTLVLYTEKALSNLGKQNSNGSYTGDKTVKLSIVGKVGKKYCMYENGKYVTSFTSNSAHTYFWESTTYPGKTGNVYRTRTYRKGNLFTREVIGEWSDFKPESGEYETRVVYDYIDIISDAGSGVVDGTVRHFPDSSLGETGKIDSAEDLSGKVATIMIYQSKNFDPNSYQMQYVGQTTITDGNYVDFDYVLKNDPNFDTGNYIISLGVQGSTGLVTVGRVEAPKRDCYVKFYYTESDGTNNYFIGNSENNEGAIVVKENGDLDIGEINIPDREGYYFAGFDKSTTNITSDTSIKAIYLPVMNAIVYVDWVNKSVNIEKALTGPNGILPGAVGDSEGYKFKGWKMPDGTIKAPGEAFDITGDMVISAEFEQEEFTVRFIEPNGNIVDEQKVKYGEAAEPPAYSPSAGTFVSWNTDANWWSVEGNVDVYPVIVYNDEALSPKATVTLNDEGERQVELYYADTEVNNKIYYTTDGTAPSNEMIAEYINTDPGEYHGSIIEYTGPVTFEEDTDIMAVGYEEGKNESAVEYLCFEKESDQDVDNDFDSPFTTVEANGRNDGWIQLGTFDVKARPGKNVYLEVSLDENPGLAGYDFLIECDSGVFLADRDEYDDPIAESGELSVNGILNTSDFEYGYRMLWYGDETVTDVGTLFNMTLHADEESEEGTYPVTVFYAPENTVDEYDEVELNNVNIKIESEAAVDISTCDVRLSRDSFVYEGTAIEPAVSIEGLKEGEDFEVNYEDNTNVGTAKAVILGIGDYVGSVEKAFTITQANIINAELENIPPQEFTGSAIEPELNLSYNGIILYEGEDYEVSYSNNKKAGTATVIIKGLGNFKGTAQYQFEITGDDGPGTEQNWGEPVWTWSDDGSTAKAIFTNADNGQTMEYIAVVTVEKKSDSMVYTATVTGPDGKTYTEIKTMPFASDDILRIFGTTRYLTAFKNANKLKEELGVSKFSTVVVATGTNFPDSLSGAYLANVKNAPILLISEKEAANVRNYIGSNLEKGGTVYILGGEGVVKDSWLSGLSGFQKKRLAGSTRYETNIEVLKEVGYNGGDILVATGLNYPDSLAGSSVEMPILLVKGDSLMSEQTVYLNGLGKDVNCYIAGGSGAVSAKMEQLLKGYGKVAKRFAGTNRYETSRLIAEEFFGDSDKAVLAVGSNFPDGLSVGPLAAKVNAPILLTDNGAKSKSSQSFTDKHGIKSGIVIGGPALISDDVAKSVLHKENILLYE